MSAGEGLYQTMASVHCTLEVPEGKAQNVEGMRMMGSRSCKEH